MWHTSWPKVLVSLMCSATESGRKSRAAVWGGGGGGGWGLL